MVSLPEKIKCSFFFDNWKLFLEKKVLRQARDAQLIVREREREREGERKKVKKSQRERETERECRQTDRQIGRQREGEIIDRRIGERTKNL